MKRILSWVVVFGVMLGALLRAQQGASMGSAKTADASPHTVQLVTVEKDVKLEVLDWGGTGRALVLLAELGDDAHEFDSRRFLSPQHRRLQKPRCETAASCDANLCHIELSEQQKGRWMDSKVPDNP